MPPRTGPATRDKLLDAAVLMIREKGYAATRVEDLCATTGVTKGAFFHHFDSKEALARAAIDRFAERAAAMFADARCSRLEEPRDRVLGYVDLRIAMLEGSLPEITCLHGTVIQEVYLTHPELSDAAARRLASGAEELAVDIAAAKKQHAPRARWTARSLAVFIDAVIQGAFVMAKATKSTATAADCLRHLRTYLETQLPAKPSRRPHDRPGRYRLRAHE
jgi:TetR/AcrR family transcriptional repressor of nem operon